MNIKKLKLLQDDLRKRDPEEFDQNSYSGLIHGNNCGCVIISVRNIGYTDLAELGFSRTDDYVIKSFEITNNQFYYIFGTSKNIFKDYNEPRSTTLDDSIYRIQNVIEGKIK